MSRRVIYTLLLPLIVAVGLFSRQFQLIPAETGDALWAWMIFGIVAWVVPDRPVPWIAVLGLFICFSVEFSQLYTADWIVRFRRTLAGRLILGQGFLWEDLIAYTIGIIVASLADYFLLRKKGLPSGKP